MEPLATEERSSWRDLATRVTVDFSPLRDYPDYRRLWIGQAVTFVGSEMALVALPFQVWQLTHSPLSLGLFSLTELIPLLTLTLAGGAVADAFDRRRMVLVTETLQAVGIAGRGPFRRLRNRHDLVRGHRRRAVGTTPDACASERGSARDPLDRGGIPLRLAREGDPRLLPRRLQRDGVRDAVGAFPGDRRSLRERHVPRCPLCGAGRRSAHRRARLGRVAYVRRQGLVVVAAASLWGVAIVGFAFADRFWLALVLVGLAGLADQVSAIFRNAMLLALTPDRLLGRVRGIEFMQVASAPSLGNLEAGVVASLTSIRTSVASGGVLCVAGTLASAAAFPALIRYEAKRRADA